MNCPGCHAKIADDSAACRFCKTAIRPSIKSSLRDSLPAVVTGITVLGGDGLPLERNQRVDLLFDKAGPTIAVVNHQGKSLPQFVTGYSKIRAIEVLGEGTVRSGGGFAGGGFGLEGALVGMGVAALLNALTTSSKTTALLRMGGPSWEFWGITAQCDPLTLRILLSPAFVRIELAQSVTSGEIDQR